MRFTNLRMALWRTTWRWNMLPKTSRLGDELKSKRADIKTGREALAREREWAKNDGRVIPSPEKVTAAGKQLQQLSKECSAVSNELLQELEKLKIKGPHKRWESFRQALNSVWSQEKTRALETRLEGIRKQLDTTLLVCLRERIDALPSVHIPQPSDDMKGFMEENKQWQADLLDAIYQKNLQVNNTNHIAMVSTQLDESARLQTEASFHRMILKHLDFPDRPEREDRICEAHQNTFDWIFHTASKGSKPWASFVDWLETDDFSNIYWITGKAGSGKSTLMKYLYHDPRTMEYLKTWVGGSPLLTAGFYFWNSGTVMQMSRMGLLQSLLHQILKQRPQLTTKLFADRYETYNPLGGRLPNWTWAELSRAFHILTSDESLRLFLLIDGLDEFDGDHGELVDMIVGVTRLPHVKICTASRPWLVFEDAFENRPNLLLEQLTYDDIKLYITTKFNENRRYSHLKARELEYASNLIEGIIEKASGVFLWVRLVVQSLLQGLTNSDRISDLQRRLETLPSDLEDLFDKILNSLDSFYYKHACQYLQIVRAAQYPISLLGFYYADEEDTDSGMRAEVKELTNAEQKLREEDMRRRLNSRCKGLLEAPFVEEEPRVQYLHRTVKDFVEMPHVWAKISNATNDSFDPVKCLANSYLWQLKTLSDGKRKTDTFWETVFWSLDFAMLIELRDSEPQADYINEVEKVGSVCRGERVAVQWPSWDCKNQEPSFLNLAVEHGLCSYVEVTLVQAQPPLDNARLTSLLQAALLGPWESEKVWVVALRRTIGKRSALSNPPFPNARMVEILLEFGADPKVSEDLPLHPEIKKLCEEYSRRKKWYHKAKGFFKHVK